MIVLRQVTCGYGDQLPIRKLDFTFPEFGCVAVTGPSGSGKSTLLKLLSGLLLPVGGSVTGLSQLRVSMVFQEERLLPWRTALENVALPNPEGDAMGCLGDVELMEDAFRLPKELSGGMQRRVALARALNFGGDVLLLDEPFKGLDADLKLRVIERMRARFALTVIATHDLAEAHALGGAALAVLSLGA